MTCLLKMVDYFFFFVRFNLSQPKTKKTYFINNKDKIKPINYYSLQVVCCDAICFQLDTAACGPANVLYAIISTNGTTNNRSST